MICLTAIGRILLRSCAVGCRERPSALLLWRLIPLLQGRHPRSQFREHSLCGLIELLRIPKQHDQRRRVGAHFRSAVYFSEASGGALSGERRKCVACSNE
jgi:hypothetical protein